MYTKFLSVSSLFALNLQLISFCVCVIEKIIISTGLLPILQFLYQQELVSCQFVNLLDMLLLLAILCAQSIWKHITLSLHLAGALAWLRALCWVGQRLLIDGGLLGGKLDWVFVLQVSYGYRVEHLVLLAVSRVVRDSASFLTLILQD